MSLSVAQRAARVTCLVLDVDGVLTNGTVGISGDGQETKFFNIQDGHGLKLAMRAGIEVIWLSGRASGPNRVRSKELKINELREGVLIKLPALEEIMAQRGLAPEQVAFMGDDLIDLPPMRKAGLALAPADAAQEVKEQAHWVSSRPGGRGAVRQAVELILKAQDKWHQVTARYFENA